MPLKYMIAQFVLGCLNYGHLIILLSKNGGKILKEKLAQAYQRHD